ncbi:MAG TPA: hypothetical protein VFA90_08260 [Terriglobales bacterium]|nr:hypothetical protein [Terriglobales bacterium]
MPKIGISWIAVVAGLAVGVLGLAFSGSFPVLGPGTYARGWWFVVGSAIFGFCFLHASTLGLQNRTRAGLLLLVAAPIVTLFVRLSQFSGWVDLQICIVPAAACVIFAGFWLLTRRWPACLPPIRLPFIAKVLGSSVILFVLIAAVSIGAIALTIWSPDIVDCGEGPTPNYKPHPEYPVFVARVIYSDPLVGSVAVIQERFWNLRHETNVVFLKALWKPGDVYFVAGRLSDGLLTRWLFPVINMHCSRSNPIQYAGVDLRVLRAGRPKSGARIIGRVEKRGNYRQLVQGVKVIIKGSRGTLIVTTDHEGIYDLSGVLPGQYEVRPENNKDEIWQSHWCHVINLGPGDVGGCTLHID